MTSTPPPHPTLSTHIVFFLALLPAAYGSYIITAPREWVRGSTTQVCVFLREPLEAPGGLTLSANSTRRSYMRGQEVNVLLPPVTIPVPAGISEYCEDVLVPKTDYSYGKLSVLGQLGGVKVNHTADLNFQHSLRRTIIQTDKHRYLPGQTVNFRILTFDGANFTIFTNNYPEVWVTSPSGTRIAQWLQVDNSAGLVHLEMTLIDEPEEGYYTIHAKRGDNENIQASFVVEEYVLPRYQVTITPPRYVLATDPQFKLTVCAKYTFGQPVAGNLTLEVRNNQYRDCQIAFNITEEIAGCRDVVVRSSNLRMIDCEVNSVSFMANVFEEGTGVVFSSLERVSVSRQAVNFNLVYKDNYVKPNLPFLIKVRAEMPDKSPAGGLPVELCAGDLCSIFDTPENGLITRYISSYIKKIQIKALTTRAPLYEAFYSTTIEQYFSPSNSSFLIHAPEGDLKCLSGKSDMNHVLPVFFSATERTTASITVQVISRYQIQYSHTGEYELSEGELPIRAEDHVRPTSTAMPGTIRGTVNIPIKLPYTASPTARVVVWMVTDDGEVVSDSRELKVEKCLNNNAQLSWSFDKAQPGEEVQLSLQAAPNSLCSLGVVDKSVELLNPTKDQLTISSIFSPLTNFKVGLWSGNQVNDYDYCRKLAHDKDHVSYFTKYVDALQMFQESGLFIFSDLEVETRPCEKEEQYYNDKWHEMYSPGDRTYAMSLSNEADTRIGVLSRTRGGESSSSKATEEPRTEFPETWLWDLKIIPASGELSEAVTLPDTITQWVGKAVCVHPDEGIGITDKINITTFTPFFLDLTLPPSIKRGEILSVKISLFNYLNRPLPVAVTVQKSSEYEILGGSTAGQYSVCISGQSKVVLAVKIKPTELGKVNITVGAVVDHDYPEVCGVKDTSINRRDALIKPLTVEAEGFPREKTWTKYICSRDFEEKSDELEESWEVAAPAPIVEGSDRGWFTVVGDLLALSVKNLGGLIKMPYGCGEQNMLNFVPNIFILQYLEATQQEAPEATSKLLNFMNTGYQRQLLYRHHDGSFSAFGQADKSGSTWLTAFVTKSFAQAQPYILIDTAKLNETRDWLKHTQTENGCFRSLGKIFNKGMKGGVDDTDSMAPLTAYVLISLLEAGEDPASYVVGNATTCINLHTINDPYTLALKAYALALSQHLEAELVLKQLLEQAVITKNSTHWELPKGPWRSHALAVETAGYAILAMMTVDSEAYNQQARKVVKWITAQRNGRGGFYSTQDTVVALQALASYESHQYQGDLNLVATVKARGLDHSFAIDETNNLLTQLIPLPDLPATLSLSMVGQGCAVFQSVLRYNVHDPEPSDAFSLTVSTSTVPDKNCVTKRVEGCATYLLPDGKSNMAVMEINLISGYIPEKEDLKAIVSESNPIKRYEVDGSKVSFYVDEFTTKEELCVSIRALRVVDVENPKPAAVVVYDYYQPEFSISKSYSFPSADECLYAW